MQLHWQCEIPTVTSLSWRLHQMPQNIPAGSSGGPDDITAQQLRDLLAGAPDERFMFAVTDFVNVLQNGELPLQVREIIFGGRLIALQQKDGWIRPIAVGYTLRQLAAKCVNSFVIKKRSNELQPMQVGAGASGGVEAANYAVCRFAEHLPDDQEIVKLNFSNAFNSVRRDTILISVLDKMPELYRFVHASLHCSTNLSYGVDITVFAEGSQQGDPLSSME